MRLKSRYSIKSVDPIREALSRFPWENIAMHITPTGTLKLSAISSNKHIQETEGPSFKDLPETIRIQVDTTVFTIVNTAPALLEAVYRLKIPADQVFSNSVLNNPKYKAHTFPVWKNCNFIQDCTKKDSLSVFHTCTREGYLPLYATKPYHLADRGTLWFTLVSGKLLFIIKNSTCAEIQSSILCDPTTPWLSKQTLEAGIVTLDFQKEIKSLVETAVV